MKLIERTKNRILFDAYHKEHTTHYSAVLDIYGMSGAHLQMSNGKLTKTVGLTSIKCRNVCVYRVKSRLALLFAVDLDVRGKNGMFALIG